MTIGFDGSGGGGTGLQRLLPAPAFQGSRSQVVADAIRKAILSGKLVPGQPLVERELSELFGVSKTPVREALIGLVGSGLIDQSQYRGMTVQTVTPELVRSVYETRDLLEPAAIAMSARNMTDADIEEAGRLLEEAAERGRQGDRTELQLLNRRFHRRLYLSCGNPLLCRYLDGLQDLVALIAIAGWAQKKTWEGEHEEHHRIMSAVARRDPREAEHEAREHMNRFADQMMENFDLKG
ncbi:DNA-binding GntR family transcriptional regulator [Spinactinospora alkalitolerans]|uniref:DNA-binding GntR family transcriptional regulator n=1 Tax=Spinactinospora alkalitolerans TaxID=687207 RepID=A0A852TX08_9ACTN|nr:GntR family transcriptional regulator [Spinactinospora alkalitolerans]NYE48478.1 DNA-binding GntR family transcriptional regulator [Spinactinospora alkalitolerans]